MPFQVQQGCTSAVAEARQDVPALADPDCALDVLSALKTVSDALDRTQVASPFVRAHLKHHCKLTKCYQSRNECIPSGLLFLHFWLSHLGQCICSVQLERQANQADTSAQNRAFAEHMQDHTDKVSLPGR